MDTAYSYKDPDPVISYHYKIIITCYYSLLRIQIITHYYFIITYDKKTIIT